MSLKVSKVYDTSRVKRNIGLFADILCTFHSVVVKENIINGQIPIPTVFHQKKSSAHLEDQNLNLTIFNNCSNSKFSLPGYYIKIVSEIPPDIYLAILYLMGGDIGKISEPTNSRNCQIKLQNMQNKSQQIESSDKLISVVKAREDFCA